MKNPKETIVFLPETPETAQRRAKASLKRWRRDRVSDLLDGFMAVTSGRAISIYYREGGRFMEFPAELSGSPEFDVVIYSSGKERWFDVNTGAVAPVEQEKQEAVVRNLEAWLRAQGKRFSLS